MQGEVTSTSPCECRQDRLSAATVAASENKDNDDNEPDAVIIEEVAQTVIHKISIPPPLAAIIKVIT